MSLRPVTFNPDGSVDVVFDETGHSGTITADQLVWVADPDGSEDHNFIVLNCPDGCGGSSTHPVGGGAAPAEVQQLFVHKTTHHGCACGRTQPGDSSALPEAHVRLLVNRMDGPGRWQASDPSGVELFHAGAVPMENSPTQFQVVYHETDSQIDGLEPAGGVGPDHRVAVIHDMDEYQNLLRYDPAYLSADKERIQGTPP